MPTTKKPAVVQGLGLAVLLLSVSQNEKELTNAVPKPSEFCRFDYNSESSAHLGARHLNYMYSFLHDCEITEAASQELKPEDEQEETQGETSTDVTPSESGESLRDSCALPSPVLALREAPHVQLFAVNSVACSVASFCTLKDLMALRAVSKSANEATKSYAMFSPEPHAVFLTFPAAVLQRKAVCNQVQPPWECRNCGASNDFASLRCSTSACNTTRPYSSTTTVSMSGAEVSRIFAGQLRKDSTVATIEWIIAMTCPTVCEDVGRIEAHTNAQDGRGKGCAWIQTHDPVTQAALLKLNKRIFFDMESEEGVWICGDSDEEREALAAFAKVRGYARGRPTALPRGPMVMELPNNSRPSQSTMSRRPASAYHEHSAAPYRSDPHQYQHHTPSHASPRYCAHHQRLHEATERTEQLMDHHPHNATYYSTVHHYPTTLHYHDVYRTHVDGVYNYTDGYSHAYPVHHQQPYHRVPDSTQQWSHNPYTQTTHHAPGWFVCRCGTCQSCVADSSL